jgi:hypothetical protein
MSTHDSDSGQPPQRARRLVLRKIAGASGPPAPLPPIRTPLPSISAPSETAGARTIPPAERPPSMPPMPRRRAVDAALLVPSIPRSSPPPAPGALNSRRAASSTALPAPAASPPSFDSSTGGTPLPRRTRPSLPPVVATLAAGEPEAARPHAPQGASARKAGVVGAISGLVLVAMFVVGARIAHRLTPPPAAAGEVQPVKSSVSLPSPSPAPKPIPTAAAASESASSAVREPPRRRVPAARAITSPKAPAQAVEGQAESAPQGAPVGSAGNAAPSTSAGSGAPSDSATSLVPVIPSSPPPEVDPLVKAILEDNK